MITLSVPTVGLAQSYGDESYGTDGEYGSTSGSRETGSSRIPRKTSTSTSSALASNGLTIEGLIAKILELQKLIADRNGISTGSPTGYTFTNDLEVGAEHMDVKKLQQFLNANGFVVSPTGAGSVGNESTFFGQFTRKALAAFQSAHNITPAVGYFGPITRVLVNSLLKQ